LHQLFCGYLNEAIDLYEAAIAIHEEAGDTASALTALFQLAMAQTYRGDLDTALGTCRESLELSSRHGERWTRAYSLWITALCRWHLGQMARARKAAMEALEIQQDFKDSICAALTIELLSWIAASESQFDSAAELANAATAVWTGLGTTVDAFGPHLRADSVGSAETVRNHLGGHRLAEIAAQQPSMTKDEAIAKALGLTPPESKPAAVTSPLTARERGIAALVAEGLSNRAIAQTLVISPRTVDGHVEHILSKLGFVSRAQIASWAAREPVPTPR
jgi:DNA-binding CsgD family transcriptional regulator